MKPFEVFQNSKSPHTKYHEKPVTDSQAGGKVLKEDVCGFLFSKNILQTEAVSRDKRYAFVVRKSKVKAMDFNF